MDDKADGFYIVTKGSCIREFSLRVLSENKWPIDHHKWKLKVVKKTLGYPLQIKAGEYFGDEELIDHSNRRYRVYAKDDCYILFITKKQFYQTFDNETDWDKFRQNGVFSHR
eukprot:TRINITY_DN2727_c0_g1_i16.p5 TRINITY_DN2727_c0_g1~~TRINITY_DN2727_c0_g1_i16.p5  ORF type:complete len:112 (+),score=23.04 TRINITY_DN2727_c0_g1_i16:371-706(+)